MKQIMEWNREGWCGYRRRQRGAILLRLMAASLCVAAVAAPVSADPITINIAHGFIGGEGHVQGLPAPKYFHTWVSGQSLTDADGRTLGTTSTAFASSLTAYVSESTFGAMGSSQAAVQADVDAGKTASALGRSLFQVGFTLATPHYFAVDANLEASGDIWAESVAFVSDSLGGLPFLRAASYDGSQTVFGQSSGVLMPGQYAFGVQAFSSQTATSAWIFGSSTAAFDVTLRLKEQASVPETATMALFAIGLAATHLRRRRGPPSA